MNGGIINSITKLHLVGISTESSTMHGSMSIKSKEHIAHLTFIEDLNLPECDVVLIGN
jgi:hypothetical protein